MNKLKEVNKLLPIYRKALNKKEWTRDFFEDLKNDITYHSNKIEGLTLTYGETMQFLKYGLIENGEDGKKLKDITALDNHRKVLDQIFDQYESFEVSTITIKNIHKELLSDPLNKNINISNVPGQYKEEINGTYRLGENEKMIYHEFLAPSLVPYEMEKLMKEINLLLNTVDLENPSKHPVTIAAYFHYKFSNIIHPFHDGNGRIARLYSNLILMKNGFPPVVVRGEGKDREIYIRSIIQSSERNLNPLIGLIADRLNETLVKGIARSETFDIKTNKGLRR